MGMAGAMTVGGTVDGAVTADLLMRASLAGTGSVVDTGSVADMRSPAADMGSVVADMVAELLWRTQGVAEGMVAGIAAEPRGHRISRTIV